MTAKFRIRMARQLGEKVARDHGFTAFRIDPFQIAQTNDIAVERKPPEREGVSGGIIFTGDDVIIFHATNIDNAGFQRFTVAHELGHFFLPGHPEEIQAASPVHVSRAGFSQGGASIEIEADHFAAGLLMPTHLVRQCLRGNPLGLDGIVRLCEAADCSLTAAAIRASECAEVPMAIVVSRGEEIAYGFLSESFKSLKPTRYPRKGMALPGGATRDFNSTPGNVLAGRRICGEASFSDWFEGARHTRLDEEVVGLGRYGLTLTVLTSEELPLDPEEEDDEEQRLADSWTPRFAYGR
ncbi:MAG: hypothetical protein DI556_21635 [Rhodovulum sulfidophilum]|uniref:IrrE N-terminal-like domain-containing protein n=1 Tax=Rhodovulum sulfidophilum TaxID=35806 RepID=A0A2W5Q3M0_RHOSU|nr:MAG: hypothetical protein DI556_21635 [Rhodovulum sulfidophilum]